MVAAEYNSGLQPKEAFNSLGGGQQGMHGDGGHNLGHRQSARHGVWREPSH